MDYDSKWTDHQTPNPEQLLYGRSRCCAPSQSAKRADELNFDMDPKRISTSPMLQDPTTFNAIGILIDYTIGKDLETWSCKKLFEMRMLAQKILQKLYRNGIFEVN